MSQWRERVRARDPFVAENDGELLGFAELMADGRIDYFYCHHRHRREGAGRRLYQAIGSEARRLGLPRLRAAVSITAKPFFARMGSGLWRNAGTSFAAPSPHSRSWRSGCR